MVWCTKCGFFRQKKLLRFFLCCFFLHYVDEQFRNVHYVNVMTWKWLSIDIRTQKTRACEYEANVPTKLKTNQVYWADRERKKAHFVHNRMRTAAQNKNGPLMIWPQIENVAWKKVGCSFCRTRIESVQTFIMFCSFSFSGSIFLLFDRRIISSVCCETDNSSCACIHTFNFGINSSHFSQSYIFQFDLIVCFGRCRFDVATIAAIKL